MSQTLNLLKTPFHDFHVSQGARMVDFAGWDMPLLYHSIIAEAKSTRRVQRVLGTEFEVHESTAMPPVLRHEGVSIAM